MIKDSNVTQTPSTTTTDRLYELVMVMILNYAIVRELKESDPAQYASLLELAISLASQPNRVYE